MNVNSEMISSSKINFVFNIIALLRKGNICYLLISFTQVTIQTVTTVVVDTTKTVCSVSAL